MKLCSGRRGDARKIAPCRTLSPPGEMQPGVNLAQNLALCTGPLRTLEHRVI